MEQRNLDFEIEISRDQWEELGRAADAASPEEEGYDWDPDHSEEIRLFARNEDVPQLWRDFVSDEETYGEQAREVARFHFNGGRPFASIDVPYLVDEPVYTEQEVDGMRRDLEQWVRTRWHSLMRRSGLHYERGLLAPAVSERAPIWKRLRADGCEWEVRTVAYQGEDDEKGRTVEVLDFRCVDEQRPARRVAVDAGELDRADGPTLISLYRRALPIGGDHYGRPGKPMGDAVG